MTLRGVAWAGAVLALVVATAGLHGGPGAVADEDQLGPDANHADATEPTVAAPDLPAEANAIRSAVRCAAFVGYWSTLLNYGYADRATRSPCER